MKTGREKKNGKEMQMLRLICGRQPTDLNSQNPTNILNRLLERETARRHLDTIRLISHITISINLDPATIQQIAVLSAVEEVLGRKDNT